MDVDAPVRIHPARFVTIKLAAAVTGLTEKAIERKIESGVWVEGKQYRRQVDDGRIYIDLQGYEKWVAKERVSNYAKAPSALGSNTAGSGAAKP